MMRQGQPIRRLLVLAWSAIVWCGLWSDLSLANAVSGVLVGALTLALVPPSTSEATTLVRPLGLLRFIGYFLWALVRASAIVAWEVVTPHNRIHQGIVETRLRTTSPGIITLIANAISLTPGTLTIEARNDPPTLYVHIMHLRTVDDVRSDIHKLEALALRAFPPAPTRPGGP